MCCGYAETRPAQQEAYKQLKAHLDKVRSADPRADDGIPGVETGVNFYR